MHLVANRFHTLLLVLLVLMGGTIIAILATRASGGPLDPPGPPGSTDGVRGPGTPISSIPYTISQPGFYYVTRNLTQGTNGANGIIVSASDVTLDLGGFQLDGASIGTNGVFVAFLESSGVTIRNGTATNWTNDGFNVTTLGGVLEDVQASNNGQAGIRVDGATVSRCAAKQNGDGVNAVRSTISNCSLINNIRGATLDSSVLENSVLDANTRGVIPLSYSNVQNNTITNSLYDGIWLVGGDGGSSITHNVIDWNGQAASGNGIYDQSDNNRIEGNNLTKNYQEGIDILGSYNTVDDNSALRNGDYGIFVALGMKNTIVRNSSLGNATANYLISPGNNPGNVITANTTNDWSNTQ